MEICFLLLSIYFYFLDFGSDILLDIEQYESLKQNDDEFTLTSFFDRSFTKHYCEGLKMSGQKVNGNEGESMKRVRERWSNSSWYSFFSL